MKIEEIKSRLALIDDRFLEDLPDGVTLLPKDWSGETTRMVMNFSVWINDAVSVRMVSNLPSPRHTH